jgi:hypothetical protein
MGTRLRNLWKDWGQRREYEVKPPMPYGLYYMPLEGRWRDHLLRYLWKMATVRHGWFQQKNQTDISSFPVSIATIGPMQRLGVPFAIGLLCTLCATTVIDRYDDLGNPAPTVPRKPILTADLLGLPGPSLPCGLHRGLIIESLSRFRRPSVPPIKPAISRRGIRKHQAVCFLRLRRLSHTIGSHHTART